MLYPLDSRFASTRLFQSGGNYSDPVAKRVYDTDGVLGMNKSSSANKIQELHRLLIEKRAPYRAQEKIQAQNCEQGLLEDSRMKRQHNEQVQGVKEAIARQKNIERKERNAFAAECDARLKQQSDNIARALSEQQQEYVQWKNGMLQRVWSMPTLGPAGYYTDEKKVRQDQAEKLKALNASSSRYFKDMKQTIANMGPPKIHYGPKESFQDIVELKVAKGLKDMQAKMRNYNDVLDEIDTKCDMQGARTRKEIAQAIRESVERRKEGARRAAAAQAEVNAEFREWRNAMVSRIKNRPKGYAGYVPVVNKDDLVDD